MQGLELRVNGFGCGVDRSRSDEESSTEAFCAGLKVGGLRRTTQNTSSVSATTGSHTERDRIPEDALNCPRELKEGAAGPETARLDEECDADLISA